VKNKNFKTITHFSTLSLSLSLPFFCLIFFSKLQHFFKKKDEREKKSRIRNCFKILQCKQKVQRFFLFFSFFFFLSFFFFFFFLFFLSFFSFFFHFLKHKNVKIKRKQPAITMNLNQDMQKWKKHNLTLKVLKTIAVLIFLLPF